MDKPRKFNVGDKVKWGGTRDDRSPERIGVIEKFFGKLTCRIRVESINKRTGKPNKTRHYTPYVSRLRPAQ